MGGVLNEVGERGDVSVSKIVELEQFCLPCSLVCFISAKISVLILPRL